MDRETKSQTAPRGSLIFEYDRVDFHRAENISNRNISVGFYIVDKRDLCLSTATLTSF